MQPLNIIMFNEINSIIAQLIVDKLCIYIYNNFNSIMFLVKIGKRGVQMEALSKQAAYAKVYADLKEKITSGYYPTGTLLPPEPKLEEMFFVSRTTVRKAVSMLINDGLVKVKQGHGTEVINPKVAQNLNTITSVSQTLEKKGYRIGTKSMYIRVITGNSSMCDTLRIPQNSKIVEINRIQTADDRPVAVAKNYIPYGLVPGIEQEKEKIISLYSYLLKRYQLGIDSSHDTISACNSSFEESEMLQIEPGRALITIRRVCYSGNVPIEVDDVKIIADKYEFEICTHS